MKQEHTNALIHESSPYLLQHAHNPVAWEAWKPEILERARRENKLLLISIGYAACHWCHVMEKECFEDREVAEVMNRHFIPIKVDREERPDVDHIYMDALQLMTGGGGWPLNVVALPDGRPFWGATYVRKADWMQALRQLAGLYRDDPEKVEGYAGNLADGLRSINQILPKAAGELVSMEKLAKVVREWSDYFDTYLGGYKRAPKFMMPVNLNFLMHYAHSQGNTQLMDYVHTSLTKMAYGGIFDHIGGGFSRYSVDVKWHVPHFEKMLYDNAQLISLYARAFALSGKELYKNVVNRCVDFVKNELMGPHNGFYASLDADSENREGVLEEGAYYVWRKEELRKFLGDKFELFSQYFSINDYGHWEEGKFVLIRDKPAEEIAADFGLSGKELQEAIDKCRRLLKEERDKRQPPRLDNKVLTSWNGLMLQALSDASRYLSNGDYLDLALKNATFLKERMMGPGGEVFHNLAEKEGRIPGYLEDYSSLVEAFISLYQLTQDEDWLQQSKLLMDYCTEHFYDPESGMFFFTSSKEPYVVRRTLETSDNVIPASNSMMAKNLFILSRYFPEEPYLSKCRQMLVNVQDNMLDHAQSHANWLQLLLFMQQPFYELAISGPEAEAFAGEFLSRYLPNLVVAASREESSLPLLRGRYPDGETLLYLCREGSCQLPVSRVGAVLEQLMAE